MQSKVLEEAGIEPASVPHTVGDVIFREVVNTEELKFVIGNISPGGGTTPHIHNNSTEIYYVVHGNPTFDVGDQQIEARPGNIIRIEPGTLHGVKNLSDAEAKVILVHIAGSLAAV
ncbi:MAG: cupin domain-containing protein [Thermincola sp.]|nr:cupin domain-containing protein [Thermincola sp.]MDT3704127.1 cupin domain-containing protein [Thermincola sp.]